MGELEKNLQKKCIEYLKAKGIYYINQFGHGWSGKGTPDLICCVRGKFVAFELKVAKNTLQPDQQIHRERIFKNGGLHYSPTSFEQFAKHVDALSEED